MEINHIIFFLLWNKFPLFLFLFFFCFIHSDAWWDGNVYINNRRKINCFSSFFFFVYVHFSLLSTHTLESVCFSIFLFLCATDSLLLLITGTKWLLIKSHKNYIQLLEALMWNDIVCWYFNELMSGLWR